MPLAFAAFIGSSVCICTDILTDKVLMVKRLDFEYRHEGVLLV